jgi:pimeloyl-ACP methyl ester carboxylesterase
VQLPREIPIEEFRLRIVDRPSPTIFWYEDAFRFSLAPQRGSAPLVFVVAGTNAGHRSRLSVYLQKLFFMAGFHVVSVSSPTFPNFIVQASSTGVPGRITQDADDLYRALQMALARVRQRVDVGDRHLVGYSLGGWQSAFVARLDDQRRALGLRKVLLINPPVSLYRSSKQLDGLVTENIPGGVAGIEEFIDRALQRITAALAQSGEPPDFAQDFLFQAYQALKPTNQQLAALVGVAFRLASANIAFSADVMSRWGYLVATDRRLTVASSLTPYFDRAMQYGFVDYFDKLLHPYYETREPGLTRADMIAEASLESIEPFLAHAPNVDLVTSADDIILAPGDIDFLRRVFAGRETIFPTGGHCGNMRDRHVAAAYIRHLVE